MSKRRARRTPVQMQTIGCAMLAHLATAGALSARQLVERIAPDTHRLAGSHGRQADSVRQTGVVIKVCSLSAIADIGVGSEDSVIDLIDALRSSESVCIDAQDEEESSMSSLICPRDIKKVGLHLRERALVSCVNRKRAAKWKLSSWFGLNVAMEDLNADGAISYERALSIIQAMFISPKDDKGWPFMTQFSIGDAADDEEPTWCSDASDEVPIE